MCKYNRRERKQEVHVLITEEYLADKDDELMLLPMISIVCQAAMIRRHWTKYMTTLIMTMHTKRCWRSKKQDEQKEEEMKKSHPWWNRELWKRKKDFRKAERLWLQCRDKEKRRALREVYTLKRREYSRAIKQEKKNFIFEKLKLGNPLNCKSLSGNEFKSVICGCLTRELKKECME